MYSKIVSTILGKSRTKEEKKESAMKAKKVICPNAVSGAGPAPFGGDSAHCEHCGRTEEEEGEYDAMGHKDGFISRWNRWNVKYLGSFPISNTTAEYVGLRLEKFNMTNKSLPTPSLFTVSSHGVRVQADDTNEILLSHSLRRIISVVGRPSFREIAYIAFEPAGSTYRRLCHVFRTQEIEFVEEIESVLGNAFQAAVLRSRVSSSVSSAVLSASTTTSTPVQAMNDKRASSSAFLSRLIGRTTKEPEDLLAKSAKRKRRPVSAVFSALHRFSSTTTVTNKRMTSFEPLLRNEPSSARVAPASSPVPEEPVPPSRMSKSSSDTAPPSLIYDEKLGEHIYPVDEALQAQLENVNYFVRLPTRDMVFRNLLRHPEGAFVLRYSESKKNCLVLSVRVPKSHNENCISHYLIIRNEAGYRIKGFPKTFPSLQMLVTHHSVLPEQLPVALFFVQWNKEDWTERRRECRFQQPPEEPRGTRNSIHHDENRAPEWIQQQTPRRRPISSGVRHSRIFEIE